LAALEACGLNVLVQDLLEQVMHRHLVAFCPLFRAVLTSGARHRDSKLYTSRRRSLPWISPTYSLEVKSFSRGEAESIFRWGRVSALVKGVSGDPAGRQCTGVYLYLS
jgi:hypothetical protein